MTLSRREFIQTCGGDGRLARVGRQQPAHRATKWRERRDLYPEGVASGDPDPNSVILWTRRPFDERRPARADRRGRRGRGLPPGRRACTGAGFRGVRLDDARARRRPQAARTSTGIASPTPTGTAAASAGRSPRRPPNDPRPVNFAFVSCQDVNEGKLNAYRRMIFEDERARARRPARFRPSPRRFHLRGRRISGGGEDPLRPHHLRGRAHSRTAARSATSTSR